MHRTSRILLLALLVVLASLGAAPPASAATGNVNPTILPPNSHPYGASYSEWSEVWWKWAVSFPVDACPLLDTAPCDAGQSGPVWFLGSSFLDTVIRRECTIPAGTALFFMVVTAECSTYEAPPFYGGDEAELRACADAYVDTAIDIFATIDGTSVQSLADYRVQSPLFDLHVPAGGLFGEEVNTQSVADGYWLMLAPLPPGQHVLHFGATYTYPPAYSFDVIYNLTVRPGGRGRGQVAGSSGALEAASWSLVKELYR